ncbi:hypothetical protein KCMC57_up34310 [Kitasatospora sp. CMC57]|uniref:Nucleotidyltransferase AbiEii toxin of type IV toxin-antitoxin system n=1 Tax=Kitasatospora sp. CMC57 TaxID=3231513 RepID=A0AB33K2R9_9ACTN
MSPISDPGRRLLADLLLVGRPYPLVLGGDCAALAHGLLERPVRTVELATESPEPLAELTGVVAEGLARRGWSVQVLVGDPLVSALAATEPGTGEEYGVELRKETFWQRPVQGPDGPVLALEDLVGTEVRALADQGLPRNLVDLHAVSDRWSYPELETLGRHHAGPDGLDLTELQARLSGADWIDDGGFTALGLPAERVPALRGWAQGWVDDLAERLMEATEPTDPEDRPAPEAAEDYL